MRARKSVPMVASKRCGSGEPSTSRPKAGVALSMGPSRRGSRATDWALCATGSVSPSGVTSAWGSHCVGSKPRLGPQKGMVSELAKACASSLAPSAKSQSM